MTIAYKPTKTQISLFLTLLVIGLISLFSSGHSLHTSILDQNNKNEKVTETKQLQKENPRRRLEFVHITKTGGTSIENAMAQQLNSRWGACHFLDWKKSSSFSNGALQCPKQNENEILNYTKYEQEVLAHGCSFWHAPSWLLPTQRLNPYHDSDLFSVIRNPYDRVVSDYYWRFTIVQKKLSNLISPFHMNNWVTSMLQPRLAYVDDANPWKYKEHCKHGGHWVPQYQYIFNPKNEQVVKHVLRTEHLQEDFDKLMLEYNLNITLSHVNKASITSKQRLMTSEDLSLENRKLIETIYAWDFHAFGYPRFSQEEEEEEKEEEKEDQVTETKKLQKEKPRRRLEFVHITKTGGTSIENAMAQQLNGRWGACHFLDWKKSFSGSIGALQCPKQNENEILNYTKYDKTVLAHGCEFWHAPSWLLPTGRLNPYHNSDLFSVIRNPYDRVVSDYYWNFSIVQKKLSNLISPFHMNNWVTSMLKPRLAYVDDVNPWKYKEHCKGGGHWVPQYQYIFNPKNEQVVKHVLRMENLQEDFDKLMLEYSLNITLSHVNKASITSKQRLITSQDLSLENRKMIETIYDMDFHAFGYPRFSGQE